MRDHLQRPLFQSLVLVFVYQAYGQAQLSSLGCYKMVPLRTRSKKHVNRESVGLIAHHYFQSFTPSGKLQLLVSREHHVLTSSCIVRFIVGRLNFHASITRLPALSSSLVSK